MLTIKQKQTYTHAALMGDLVDSQAADPAVLHLIFNEAIAAANDKARDHLASPLTITLGDEFQGLLGTLAEGVRLMRFLRLELLVKGVDCRFALGMVRIDTPVNPDRAWNMMGPGLAATRARLEDKRSANAYRFELPGQDAFRTVLDVVGAELTDLERGWTARQRDTIKASFSKSPLVLARGQGLSVQTIYKILRAGRLEAYERMWDALSVAASHLDAEYGLT